ncbi:ABC transporter permease [Luteimicrobium subarcticum]|uniref:Peptide/nickel transport system permease protein n=1 Tax=Luteimicrobium subarcticum TaxID=620910 RepID=A0A2M8WUM0_9MICO|nr:ABC transporter permease [Luteimicrobium subarcticum]PJI94641.1 peptide/nickel transport system permease protein [Luteimicrobium subarcticum]
MLTFLVRRLVAGVVTLFVSMFLMYLLVNRAIDPLADLRESTAANKQQLIALRIQQLDLHTNVVIRFFRWFGGVLHGDLGIAWRSKQPVSDLLAHAIGSTLQLVTAATFLALVLGVAVGIVSALRQYSSFDYLIIFLSFLLYSLPSFWIAVLLKQWGAIGFNDFLKDPTIAWPTIAVISVIFGVLWMLAIGGTRQRRLQTLGLAFAATFALFAYLQLSDWWLEPQISLLLVVLLGAGSAFAIVAIFAGLHNRRALYAALTTVVVGAVLYYPMHTVFSNLTSSGSMNNWVAAGFGLLAVVVGVVIGRLFGGPDWGLSARCAGFTALIVSAMIYVNEIMRVWPPYFRALGGRPIPTFGDSTPDLGGNYWVTVLDALTHLVLPSITLILVAFAAYTRYSRSSMLEVMSQDYIRTARAKGLPERVVVVRHGFRNTLIPLATIVPIDVITLIGGAVITEAVFARPGMGQLFVQSLQGAEINPVMAYLLVTAALAIIANIVADLIYAAVDPRIRLDA